MVLDDFSYVSAKKRDLDDVYQEDVRNKELQDGIGYGT
jgi:hypothetical protein